MNAIPLIAVISGLTINDIGSTILGWFKEIGQALVDMFTAPFDAINSIFTSWGNSAFGDWWGPILMAVVLVVVVLIFYFGFKVLDTFLN